jgi:hypothetical protein
MKKIISNLGISDDIINMTKPLKKAKNYSRVKDNVPLIEDYNYSCDLLLLPTDKKGFKYLFVIVDIGNDEFDMEPMKSKTGKSSLLAMETIFKRKYLNKPKSSISTDDGGEFKDEFHKYLVANKIYHKVAIAGRHSQQSSVESLNKQLGYLFNLYMNMKEKELGTVYREWTDIIDTIRIELNKLRKKPNQSISKHNYPLINTDVLPKFKIGDVVYYNSEFPLNALGKKQPTNSFRQGDYRYNVAPKKIKFVLNYAGNIPYRYVLEGLSNVSYTENQLMISDETDTKYIIKDIIGKKKIKNKIHYLVWWDKEKKADATWEPKTELLKDGLEEYIDRYENN